MTFEEEFPDNNANGIPDAFENRPPITEILHEQEEIELSATNGRIIMEMEARPRSPRKGEVFIADGRFYRATRDFHYLALIVSRFISGDADIADFK